MGNAPLAETWNGTYWKAVKAIRTTGRRDADAPIHVSCFAPTTCVTVGYSFWPGHGNTQANFSEL